MSVDNPPNHKQQRTPEQVSAKGPIERFTSSGLFFMIFGCILLIVAHFMMPFIHSSLAFILVVSGVAILLYGTGTQGIGEFGSNGYKIAIAGGAGVLALIIGYGVIEKQEEIKDAFQAQTKYIKVIITPDPKKSDGISGALLGNYFPVISVNGMFDVAAVRQKDYIEAFVNPAMLKNGGRLIMFLHRNPNADIVSQKLGAPVAKIEMFIDKIDESKIQRGSWLDLPYYYITTPITLKAADADERQAQAMDNLPKIEGRDAPPPVNLLIGEPHR